MDESFQKVLKELSAAEVSIDVDVSQKLLDDISHVVLDDISHDVLAEVSHEALKLLSSHMVYFFYYDRNSEINSQLNTTKSKN